VFLGSRRGDSRQAGELRTAPRPGSQREPDAESAELLHGLQSTGPARQLAPPVLGRNPHPPGPGPDTRLSRSLPHRPAQDLRNVSFLANAARPRPPGAAPEHRRSYARRTSAERTFSTIKDPATTSTARG
jgi:hypothetical protein